MNIKKREIQIHAAVTAMGDPLAIKKEDREDYEICQYAISIQPIAYGNLTEKQVRDYFAKLGQACYKKMRSHGMLKLGE